MKRLLLESTALIRTQASKISKYASKPPIIKSFTFKTAVREIQTKRNMTVDQHHKE